ncbi:efflux RND transporter periplasmic adaptor subunit [uncultured Cocleimonas sp.]|uniref:efflux RND transporter periplasmic adaptor subunit n=1 Tax=uncultured Cocleimonas sp. TaxID=1051587 RepID=UPI00260906AE|nr:efflux RND transporter periplasmic adaptor subunit [uncultured Cocleimonas sp.]
MNARTIKMNLSKYALLILCILMPYKIYSDNKLLNVSIVPLSSVLISTKNSGPANIISTNHSTLSAEITGRVNSINTEAGSFVRKGEKLASLDCRSYLLVKKQAKAALKVAETQLNLAKKQLARNQRLIKNGTIPRELFERTEATQQTSLADIELKKASIENTELTIERCTIKAPFSGQITQKIVQQGQLVLPGTALFQLMEDAALEVKADIPVTSINEVKGANLIEFVAGEERIKTSIRSIIQNVDVTSRTQEVRLILPDSTHLAAGISGRIEWSNGNLQIPTEFIQRKGQNLGIMIAEDIVDGTGKAKFIVLKNAIEGQPANIDLPQQTAIINKNQFRVSDGQLISIQ